MREACGAQNCVGRAGCNTQRATYACRLINFCYRNGLRFTVVAVEFCRAASEQARQRDYERVSARRALIDIGNAFDNGLRIRSATRVPA